MTRQVLFTGGQVISLGDLPFLQTWDYCFTEMLP